MRIAIFSVIHGNTIALDAVAERTILPEELLPGVRLARGVS